ERAFDLDGGADRHGAEHPLESRIPQARRDHDHVFVRRAGDGEATGIALRVGLWRVQQCDVNELAGAIAPVDGLREAESHGPFGDQVTTNQGSLEYGPGYCRRHSSHVPSGRCRGASCSPSRGASAIAKHEEWAAAASSSGLVIPWGSRVRATHVTGRPCKARLPDVTV